MISLLKPFLLQNNLALDKTKFSQCELFHFFRFIDIHFASNIYIYIYGQRLVEFWRERRLELQEPKPNKSFKIGPHGKIKKRKEKGRKNSLKFNARSTFSRLQHCCTPNFQQNTTFILYSDPRAMGTIIIPSQTQKKNFKSKKKIIQNFKFDHPRYVVSYVAFRIRKRLVISLDLQTHMENIQTCQPKQTNKGQVTAIVHSKFCVKFFQMDDHSHKQVYSVCHSLFPRESQ